ncbi:MAG TPA: RHS repeat-associated core domain-containing protein, partial [Fimbriimonadaceae bacterium]|nr:RHS repeat-associated core domain-containing protein [Fimbriimonadaceae bacterium]
MNGDFVSFSGTCNRTLDYDGNTVPFGRVNRKNYPHGMYETYDFDTLSRPTAIKTYNSSDVLQDTKSYAWDAANRITSATEGGVQTTYGYDAIDQLTSETKTSLPYSATYTYDANGNRLTKTVNGVTETYAYDKADKLLSVTGGANPRTFTYDAAGRTTAITDGAGTTGFAYDYEGRVTSITYPSQTSDAFGYNGLDARVSSSGVNGSKTFRRAGVGATSSVLSDGTRDNTPGVSSRQGGASTFQHSGLKNANEQTDGSQTVTASRVYDAFGNVVSSSGTWQGMYGYGGDFGYQEDGNGLHLLGHRYYDSSTGRFLTSDPIGAGRNWYGYTENNPVSHADPAGEFLLVLAGTALTTAESIFLGLLVAYAAYLTYEVCESIVKAIDEIGRNQPNKSPKRGVGPTIVPAEPTEEQGGDYIYRLTGRGGENGKWWSRANPLVTPDYRRRAG